MEEDRQSMELLLEKARRAVRARTAGQDATRLHATTLDEDRANNKNNNNNNSSIITTSGGSVSAPLNAKDNRVEFARHHHRLITSFVEDKTKFVLDLPNLTAFDRLVVHAVAEQSNLSHTSTGSGTQRVMRLTKDALFFEDPTAVHRVRLEELVEKVANKESRFQLRFHRAADPSQLNAGAIGSYADDEVANKVARLQRATDEYRRATNMGYSQDDLSAQEREGGRTIEEMLRQPNAEPEDMRAITSGEPTTSSSSRLAHDDHRPMRQIMPTGAMRYEEVCRGCGARAAVEGPLEKWSCAKYCAECTRQTIWALDGQPIAATTHNNNVAAPTTTTATSSTAATKRPRDGANNNKEEVPSTTSLVEAIDLDDDAQLTVEDVVEMACLNDVSPHDTNWLRRCATQHRPQVERGVAFCVSYADLLDVSLFRRFDLKGMSATCRPIYVAVREVATPMTRITTLAEAALLTAKIDDEDDDDSTKKKKTKVEEMEGQTSLSNVLQRLMPHVGVALLNVSVYGSGATAILQLRPTRQPMSSSNSTPDELICFDEEALMKLQQRYGSRHFFVSRSLHDTVKHAEEEDA